jgi:hypothetical protein
VDEIDSRLEAQLDALWLGGDDSLELCWDRSTRGSDPGDIHATARVLARHGDWPAFVALLDAIDVAADPTRGAVARALAAELPAAWVEPLTRELSHPAAPRRALAARALSFRRAGDSEALSMALTASKGPGDGPGSAGGPPELELLTALTRVAAAEHTSPVLSALATRETLPATHREAAALALLRGSAGPRERFVRDILANVTRDDLSWAAMPIALAGGPSVTPLFESALRAAAAVPPAPGGLPPAAIAMLGLHGDPVLWESLIAALGCPPMAAAAAEALFLLSGAELFEEVAVPSDPDAPATARQQPRSLRRRTQSAAAWQSWRAAHAVRFQPGVRVRLGEPVTPAAVVATVRSERLPRATRAAAALELSLRYGIDWPFETEAPARAQLHWCESEARRQQAEARRFVAGAWYRAGSRIAGP